MEFSGICGNNWSHLTECKEKYKCGIHEIVYLHAKYNYLYNITAIGTIWKCANEWIVLNWIISVNCYTWNNFILRKSDDIKKKHLRSIPVIETT